MVKWDISHVSANQLEMVKFEFNLDEPRDYHRRRRSRSRSDDEDRRRKHKKRARSPSSDRNRSRSPKVKKGIAGSI